LDTQVAIIGAGPAGLLLSRLLHLNGVANQVVERRSKEYVLGRIRAGVLEMGTVKLLDEAGVGSRMHREGLIHHGVELSFGGSRHRIDFAGLTGGSVMVYGQTEVTRDLMEALAADGVEPLYEAEAVPIEGLDGDRPVVRSRHAGEIHEMTCEFVAGCDGYHGACRRGLPAGAVTSYERVARVGWLGVLSQTPPVSDELIYVSHERGFALCSMRSHSLSRYYVQCRADEKIEEWPDERFWDELNRRLDPPAAERLVIGASIEKSVAPIRSFVVEPMRFGRLFLAGDAAHIVPPTGAKGLNLAVADVGLLARALIAHYRGDSSELDRYSTRALKRVWRAERFSWWMTTLLHQLPEMDDFGRKLQLAELEHLVGSRAAATAMAESYVGLALE
jgi:p-hydroxybenzoate 3-monooxygenase